MYSENRRLVGSRYPVPELKSFREHTWEGRAVRGETRDGGRAGRLWVVASWRPFWTHISIVWRPGSAIRSRAAIDLAFTLCYLSQVSNPNAWVVIWCYHITPSRVKYNKTLLLGWKKKFYVTRIINCHYILLVYYWYLTMMKISVFWFVLKIIVDWNY